MEGGLHEKAPAQGRGFLLGRCQLMRLGFLFSGQLGHGDAGEKARAGFIAGMAGHEVVDLLEQQVRHGDVDLVAFAQVRDHVNADDGPDPSSSRVGV
ncbi:hypothetical protein B0H98_10883 [Vreelandella songnenensis]|uniref:Uncharacterized protein n=1 Tax=Vreelandella songnenensis TaxID=1176243 RepID=A0A2T0V066_9GAMM|nr:hypothetical protein B0H98_10883 [Halomonas songnenensis]